MARNGVKTGGYTITLPSALNGICCILRTKSGRRAGRQRFGDGTPVLSHHGVLVCLICMSFERLRQELEAHFIQATSARPCLRRHKPQQTHAPTTDPTCCHGSPLTLPASSHSDLHLRRAASLCLSSFPRLRAPQFRDLLPLFDLPLTTLYRARPRDGLGAEIAAVPFLRRGTNHALVQFAGGCGGGEGSGLVHAGWFGGAGGESKRCLVSMGLRFSQITVFGMYFVFNSTVLLSGWIPMAWSLQ